MASRQAGRHTKHLTVTNTGAAAAAAAVLLHCFAMCALLVTPRGCNVHYNHMYLRFSHWEVILERCSLPLSKQACRSSWEKLWVHLNSGRPYLLCWLHCLTSSQTPSAACMKWRNKCNHSRRLHVFGVVFSAHRSRRSWRRFKRSERRGSSTCLSDRTEKWTVLTRRVEASVLEAWDLWTSPKKTTDESGFVFQRTTYPCPFHVHFDRSVTSAVATMINSLHCFSSLYIASSNRGV